MEVKEFLEVFCLGAVVRDDVLDEDNELPIRDSLEFVDEGAQVCEFLALLAGSARAVSSFYSAEVVAWGSRRDEDGGGLVLIYLGDPLIDLDGRVGVEVAAMFYLFEVVLDQLHTFFIGLPGEEGVHGDVELT